EKEASVISGIETVGVAEPANAFELLQNYPNPFNPETSIQFTLSRAANVNLTIYNIAGQKVRTLLDETLNAGSNAAVWNGKNEAGENVSSGLYYYRLRVQNQIAVKKMMLLH
ncbi:T9SS type A sorting domain-containing protein, partial [candidate division KSB1 bacterium]|nr:T9SS type A sorting domain-containing protein [candidate division KSB1 bacterium]